MLYDLTIAMLAGQAAYAKATREAAAAEAVEQDAASAVAPDEGSPDAGAAPRR